MAKHVHALRHRAYPRTRHHAGLPHLMLSCTMLWSWSLVMAMAIILSQLYTWCGVGTRRCCSRYRRVHPRMCSRNRNLAMRGWRDHEVHVRACVGRGTRLPCVHTHSWLPVCVAPRPGYSG